MKRGDLVTIRVYDDPPLFGIVWDFNSRYPGVAVDMIGRNGRISRSRRTFHKNFVRPYDPEDHN